MQKLNIYLSYAPYTIDTSVLDKHSYWNDYLHIKTWKHILVDNDEFVAYEYTNCIYKILY